MDSRGEAEPPRPGRTRNALIAGGILVALVCFAIAFAASGGQDQPATAATTTTDPIVTTTSAPPAPTTTEPQECEAFAERLTREDCIAVTSFVNAVPPQWLEIFGWDRNESPCRWRGITCANLTVTGLDLSTSTVTGRGLMGEIPPEIGNLTNLRALTIWTSGSLNGSLTGGIPPEIGNLANLETLEIRYSFLDGEIPPEITNLTNLRTLNIGEPSLTGQIPPEIGNLTNLRTLDIGVGGLRGEIPSQLGELTNLTTLRLGGMFTGEIPPELGNLTNLERLYLRGNNLTGEIPPELGNLSNLRDLELLGGNEQLGGVLPDQLLGIPELHLSETNIAPIIEGCDAFPRASLGGSQCVALASLVDAAPQWATAAGWDRDLDPCSWWAGIYCRNGAVISLDLSGFMLTGEIPPELGNLTNLEQLSLTGSDLTGEIPPELGNLTDLTMLRLSANDLTGQVPPELGNLTNLRGLNLRNNPELSGVLPEAFSNLRLDPNDISRTNITR